MTNKIILCLCTFCFLWFQNIGQKKQLEAVDIFNIEYVSDPVISPDGQFIIYTRNFKDIMTDRSLSNLWIMRFDGSNNHPLTTGNQRDFSPVWSPDGKRIVYRSNKDGKTQLYLRWLNNGSETKLSNLTQSPGRVNWSPDGRWLAFTMFVPNPGKPLASLKGKPKSAKWNKPAVFIEDMNYKADGAGFLKKGNRHIFLMSIDGGTARQITDGEYNYGNPSWDKDSRYLYASCNQREDRDFFGADNEIFRIDIQSEQVKQLTDRVGPDNAPKVSPDGQKIVYLGRDENYDGYQLTEAYLMNLDGSGVKCLTCDHDRSINSIQWSGNSHLVISYDNEGDIELAKISLSGNIKKITGNAGGLSLGRPYAGGSFHVMNDRIAYTFGTTEHPSDLATTTFSGQVKRLTALNDDLFAFKQLGPVEEIWYTSSHDGRKVQGWICKPPNFDPSKKYPMILEIHGGPFATYGPWFSMEVQLYAAAGYVVLYTNPRGSSSYGKEFGNLIHHNYPGQDYDDLISGVDEVIKKGYVDSEQLYVTGGSGGGVLTAWIVGKTDRFKAAVVAKPVINWYSFVLYADGPGFFYKYWFPGMPWDHVAHYHERSPISLVKNVTTPTMLLTGEADYRTPMAETEQYYAALKLNKVESAMVRIPGAGHGIAARPSNLMAKVENILAWFERYRDKAEE